MKKEVEVEVSARHIHLSKADYEILFGPGVSFEQVKKLSQSGEFATNKTVKIFADKDSLDARFISPFRDKTQVELSLTDCFKLGINASYAIITNDDAAEVKISGTQAEISRKAAIVTKRHLHANKNEAREFGFSVGQQIAMKTQTDRGGVIFENITVKISNNYNLRVHLDTDEGNAAGISGKCFGELIAPKND